MSHEGWQWKSSVEQSGTEIVANDLTRSFYEGACPNKKNKKLCEFQKLVRKFNLKLKKTKHTNYLKPGLEITHFVI